MPRRAAATHASMRMMRLWGPALFLLGCMANPFSSAQEWCERIRDAEGRYISRCNIPPDGPLMNCDKVWDSSASDEQLQQCVNALDAAECLSLSDWPSVCPKSWIRLPWN